MKLSDFFSKVFPYIIIQHCSIYFKFCRVWRQYGSVIFNKPYHAWFFWMDNKARLTAAVLKCTQVHLPFIFRGFSPFRKTWLWSVLQKLNVIHHTFVYKVHKMDLSKRNREGCLWNNVRSFPLLKTTLHSFNTRYQVRHFQGCGSTLK